MSEPKVSRRQFLRAVAGAAAGTLAVACQPQTVVVQETVEVQREKVVKETVVIEQEVTSVIEREVERIVEVTATPKVVREAPNLFAQVAQGRLPPIEERLPKAPRIVAPAQETGTYGGTWRRVAMGPWDVYSWEHRLTYDTGLRYGTDGIEIVPHILQGIEVGGEGTEFTFFFRKGLKWSNGEPYTVDDMLFWWHDTQMNEALSPNGPSTDWQIEGQPADLSKVDDYTLKWTFAGPYGLFIPLMASTQFHWFARYPKHYLSQFHPNYAKQEDLDKLVAQEGHDDWTGLFLKAYRASNLDAPGVKTWLAVKLPPDMPSTMERNPYYFVVDTQGNQLPYIDRLRFEVVENQSILNLKVLYGAVDMQFRHVGWDSYPLLVEQAETGDYRVFRWTVGEGSAAVFSPNMNHEDPGMRELMADRRFRRALSVALDRDEINEVVYLGMGVPRQAAVVPAYPYFRPSQAEAYAQYDPQQANAWLDEMGLTARDGEGFRLRLDSQELTINVEYAPLGVWSDVVEMACRYWADVGIRAYPKEESRMLFSERSQVGTVQDMTVWVMDRAAHALLSPLFQMPIRGLSPGSNGALWYDWYTSRGQQGEEPPPAVKRAYELFDACKSAANEDALARYATELLDLNAQELWVIGTVGLLPDVGVVKTNMHNVPEEALSDWLCLSPGNTTIEQYFFRD